DYVQDLLPAHHLEALTDGRPDARFVLALLDVLDRARRNRAEIARRDLAHPHVVLRHRARLGIARVDDYQDAIVERNRRLSAKRPGGPDERDGGGDLRQDSTARRFGATHARARPGVYGIERIEPELGHQAAELRFHARQAAISSQAGNPARAQPRDLGIDLPRMK